MCLPRVCWRFLRFIHLSKHEKSPAEEEFEVRLLLTLGMMFMFFSVAHRVIGWFFIAEEWLRCLQRSVLSSSWGFHDLKMFGEKAHNLKRCGTFFGMKVMVSSASGCWENRGLKTRWWFQIFFMFISIWGRFPI